MNKLIKEKLTGVIEAAAAAVAASQGVSLPQKPAVALETPADDKFGEVSTNLALQLARPLKMPPQKVGALLKAEIDKGPSIADIVKEVQVAGPGFLNFYLSEKVYHDIVRAILKEGAGYGRSTAGGGRKVLIEFVSANPTGPLTVAHGRQAAVGDVLANILNLAGYSATREYFINDRGRQIKILGLSTFLRYKELLGEKIEFLEDGYKGAYVYDVAKKVIAKEGARFKSAADDEAVPYFMAFAAQDILDDIRKDLDDFNVAFDVWFSEKEFAQKDRISACLDELRAKGHLYEQDGALWFRSTSFGDDKDRVLIKSNGDMTYITPDIAYHEDKLKRGFETLVNLWGPDHHGYIPRMRAAIQALGYDQKALRVIIVQLATLFQGDKQLSMSTRAGEFVTLRQVIDEVGRDAGRYFFVRRKTDSHLDFDLELAKKQSPENPVYYVQYAHARISSIFRKGAAEGIPVGEAAVLQADLALLKEKPEFDLIKLLGRFEETVETAAGSLEPHWIPLYLEEVAAKLHVFYTQCRVLSDDRALTCARLALIRGAQTVLANGLALLGVAAPDEM
ncbi:MAG TPA: arginine--tRNA ligase [bacterium]|nr:arginine--tRNA ligase [bacterium]